MYNISDDYNTQSEQRIRNESYIKIKVFNTLDRNAADYGTDTLLEIDTSSVSNTLNLVSADDTKSLDIIDTVLPTGDFEFAFYDNEKQFDPENPDSGWEQLEKTSPVAWWHGYQLINNKDKTLSRHVKASHYVQYEVAFVNSQFISYNDSGYIYYSYDGITWKTDGTNLGTPKGYSFITVHGLHSDGDTIFYKTTTQNYYSKDGITWRLFNAPASAYKDMCVVDDVWYTTDYVAGSKTKSVYISTDYGQTWASIVVATSASNINLSKVFYIDSTFYIFCSNGKVYTSSDAYIWVGLNSNTPYLSSIFYGAGYISHAGSYFIFALADKMIVSEDGINWSSDITLPNGGGYPFITYSDGKYYGICLMSGIAPIISSDCQTWEAVSVTPINAMFANIASGNNIVVMTGNSTGSVWFTFSPTKTIEWIPGSVYLTTGENIWSIDSYIPKIKVPSKSILTIMQNVDIDMGAISEDTTIISLKSLCAAAWEVCTTAYPILNNFTFSIDATIDDVIVNKLYDDEVYNASEFFQIAAQALRGTLNVDRCGNLKIANNSSVNTGFELTFGKTTSMPVPKKYPSLSTFSINYYTFSGEGSATTTLYADPSYPISGYVWVDVTLELPKKAYSATITGLQRQIWSAEYQNVVYTDAKISDYVTNFSLSAVDHLTVTFKGRYQGIEVYGEPYYLGLKLTVSYEPLTMVTKPVAYNYQSDDLGEVCNVNNPLLCSQSAAESVASFMLPFIHMRNQYSGVENRGYPHLDCGDIINAQTQYTTVLGTGDPDPETTPEAYITKTKINYDGKWSGTLDYLTV